MKEYLKHHPWQIIEDQFHPQYNRISESIFSLGNGHMGHRGNFEEKYSGESLPGSYIGGIYYPDKTRVGWWKNGYPEYFAKVLNAVNWIGIDVFINGEELDLNKVSIIEFERKLDMYNGTFSKEIKFETQKKERLIIRSTRICSMSSPELGIVKYSIHSENFEGTIRLVSYLDFGISNADANYGEQFWKYFKTGIDTGYGYAEATTKKSEFTVHAGLITDIASGEYSRVSYSQKEDYVSKSIDFTIGPKDTLEIVKYCVIDSSRNYVKSDLATSLQEKCRNFQKQGFDQLYSLHKKNWHEKWKNADIIIEGDVAAQQGIRFNIFQLLQTYTGRDARLNIGPKGFTGEKYGGSTYWDTEAYCLPFYLSTTGSDVGKNLVRYRYKHLPKAIENAAKLGIKNGAALYPMVTMNGEECHNEWEITFEEIHRNGAIAYGIYNYINYTGDNNYLSEGGIEVLIAIARFWSERCQWSKNKKNYVILGVTGPNEYENNVNNNWYTNYIARWCLEYTLQSIRQLEITNTEYLDQLYNKLEFKKGKEVQKWQDIIDHMYLPYDDERNIFLQQDGFLDKDLKPAHELPREETPIHQHWSWDRILRSCYIKQADVLQGLYFFEDNFNLDELQRNFDFYEPLTVHESSLSPCVHSILASKLSRLDKAYELYLRTARLDLDDYNNDTEDGLHITSMAGTWMSVVKGFAGMRVRDDVLHFQTTTPANWDSYQFRILFRDNLLQIHVSTSEINVSNISGDKIKIIINDQQIDVLSGETSKVESQHLHYST